MTVILYALLGVALIPVALGVFLLSLAAVGIVLLFIAVIVMKIIDHIL